MEHENRSRLLELTTIAAHRALSATELKALNELSDDGGFSSILGVRFTHLSNGEARAVLHIGAQHHQPWGVVNGGVYCAIAETVASLAGVVAAGKPVMGVNNDTNFISSVKSGPLEAVAKPIQLGHRTQVWEVEMSQQGSLKAKTTLRTMIV